MRGARLALVAFGLAAGLALAELALSLLHGAGEGPWMAVGEADSPFVFRPRAEATWPPGGDGARDGRTLFSYGDSIAAGFGVAPGLAYPMNLAAALGEAGLPGVAIRSLAHGHSPSVIAQHLRVDLGPRPPDAVLVAIELVNDVADEAHVANAPPAADGLPARLARARYVLGFDGHLLAPLAWRGFWFERTKLFTKASHAWGRLVEAASPNPVFAKGSGEAWYARRFDRHRMREADLDAAFVRLFDALGAMRRHLDERGIAFAVAVVPSRHAFETGPLGKHGRGLVTRAMQALGERDITAIDLSDAMAEAGGADAYLDFCHPTARGHTAIARALGEALSQGPMRQALAPR